MHSLGTATATSHSQPFTSFGFQKLFFFGARALTTPPGYVNFFVLKLSDPGVFESFGVSDWSEIPVQKDHVPVLSHPRGSVLFLKNDKI